MVEKPAWACHNDIGAFQQLHLPLDANTAINRNASQAGIRTQEHNGLMNLFGQFTGGSNDQGTYTSVLPMQQSMQYRQRKDSCFSGAGLGQSH